jgi:hypothetical protein
MSVLVWFRTIHCQRTYITRDGVGQVRLLLVSLEPYPYQLSFNTPPFPQSTDESHWRNEIFGLHGFMDHPHVLIPFIYPLAFVLRVCSGTSTYLWSYVNET